jgi:hypothetical protein
MSDNDILPATGTNVATDDIGGVKYQRMKLIHGNDGVNDGDVSDTNPMPVSDDAIAQLLGILLQYQDSPRGYDKSLQRQRATVLVESGTVTTVTTVTTVGTVTNLSTIDTLQGRIQVYGANLSAWHDVVRSRIS